MFKKTIFGNESGFMSVLLSKFQFANIRWPYPELRNKCFHITDLNTVILRVVGMNL